MNRSFLTLAVIASFFLLDCRSLDLIRHGLEGKDITQLGEVDEKPYDPKSFQSITLEGFTAEDFDHPWVQRQLKAFERTKHIAIVVALRKSKDYMPTIQKIFEEENLPLDLTYLPIIESGFNPRATSPSGARGVWQFMYHTGRFYKLEASYWHDDRCNVLLATRAAAHHLKWLYKQYGDWLLVLAAYNAGSGKVSRGLKRYKTTDFWSLAKHRYLKRETKQYVPKFIAATLIAKNPGKYGLPSFEMGTTSLSSVSIEDATDLRLIARCAGMAYNEVKQLNPSLKRWMTPPAKRFEVYLPEPHVGAFLSNFSQIPDDERITFRRTFVGIGQSLSGIAKHYKVPINPIAEINKLGSIHNIRAGSHLLIPIRGLANAPTPASASPVSSDARATATTSQLEGPYEFLHIVQGTDSLYTIALRFRVRLTDLMSLNNIKNPSSLRPGRLLLIRQWGGESKP